jgi:hypothetical protein
MARVIFLSGNDLMMLLVRTSGWLIVVADE